MVKKIILIMGVFLSCFSLACAVIVRQSVVDGDKYLRVKDDLTIELVGKEQATHFNMQPFALLRVCAEQDKPQVIFVPAANLGFKRLENQTLYLGSDRTGSFKVFPIPLSLPKLLAAEDGENILWTITGFDVSGTFVCMRETRLVVEHAYLSGEKNNA